MVLITQLTENISLCVVLLRFQSELIGNVVYAEQESTEALPVIHGYLRVNCYFPSLVTTNVLVFHIGALSKYKLKVLEFLVYSDIRIHVASTIKLLEKCFNCI